MYSGKLVFSQLMSYLPRKAFRRCVARYRGDYKVQQFSCWDQYCCMAFAQLTGRESLRDIEACLRAQQAKLYHMGIRGRVSRSTLADANAHRDWRMYADFAHLLIHRARALYQEEDFGVDLDDTVYALDSTTIDLCLSVFPWAQFRQTKSAVKLHTLLDLRGPIPTTAWITPARLHDVNLLDTLLPEPGALYLMDRAYLDYRRLYGLHQAHASFIIRAKSNLQFRRQYSQPVDKTTGLRCDHIGVLTGFYAQQRYPDQLRRIKFHDAETDRTFIFLTNNRTLPALTICQLSQCRWQVELFFKWIKQHLRIQSFFGTSINAVKTQLWIAISVYVLVAIIVKEQELDLSLYTFLQIISVTVFEKVDILQLVTAPDYTIMEGHFANQLKLFEL